MTDVNVKFLKEYSSAESLKQYTTDTAGYGINYLLDHDYKDIYLNAIQHLTDLQHPEGLNILEYGCGAGMNLIHLLNIIKQRNIRIHKAYGTDFSQVLIDAAKREAENNLGKEVLTKTKFLVARNENLVKDMSTSLGLGESQIIGSYHLIIGVNTFRYCHRLKMERMCADDIHRLLVPGGISIMIDMNDKFPFFRSKWRKKKVENPIETYIPDLEGYTRPFEAAGFKIITRKNFCWIPHSSQPLMCSVLKVTSPLLQACFSRYAMRSLVIAKKLE